MYDDLVRTPEALELKAMIDREMEAARAAHQRRKSTGPKTAKGKARSAQNNKARGASWSIKTSAQAAMRCQNSAKEFMAGISAALTAAGLPSKSMAIKTSYRMRVGCSEGRVSIHIKGKQTPFTRYGAAIQPYCDGWLETPVE
jgi:hypothetical protein